MFQIKNFASIAASMINIIRGNTTKITDLNPGSAARTLIEAPAVEIEEAYLRTFAGLREAIPVAIYGAFDFDLLAASYSVGSLTFTATGGHLSDITIPSGTIAQNTVTGLYYETTAEAVLAVGETTVTAPARASAVGYASNTDVGTVTSLGSSIAGIASVNNVIAFARGRDLETEAERKVRFQEYIAAIARGSATAIEYAAKQAVVTDENGLIVESVAYVHAFEAYKSNPSVYSTAYVPVYIHNGTTGTSAELVQAAYDLIYGYYDENGNPVIGYNSAGCHSPVFAASEVEVDVAGTIALLPGYTSDVNDAAELAVSAYIAGLGVGEDVIWSDIVATVKSVDGVYSFELTAPTANVDILFNQKAVPGTVTLS